MSIQIAAEPDGVEVDLWGKAFRTQRVTRSRRIALDKLQDEFVNAVDADGIVDVLARALDEQLVSVEGNAKPSAVIVKKWKADELTVEELVSFRDRLADASRPT